MQEEGTGRPWAALAIVDLLVIITLIYHIHHTRIHHLTSTQLSEHSLISLIAHYTTRYCKPY